MVDHNHPIKSKVKWTNSKRTVTIHHTPRGHYKTQVRLLQQTAMGLQMHLIESQFFLDTNTQQYISLLPNDSSKNNQFQCKVLKSTDSASRPTLCQHEDASSHYDKNDEKFGCSEEVLHVARQLDTQAIDYNDQNWEETRNVVIYRTTLECWTFQMNSTPKRRVIIYVLYFYDFYFELVYKCSLQY